MAHLSDTQKCIQASGIVALLLNPLFYLKQFANEMILDDLTLDEQDVRYVNSWGEGETTEAGCEIPQYFKQFVPSAEEKSLCIRASERKAKMNVGISL